MRFMRCDKPGQHYLSLLQADELASYGFKDRQDVLVNCLLCYPYRSRQNRIEPLKGRLSLKEG